MTLLIVPGLLLLAVLAYADGRTSRDLLSQGGLTDPSLPDPSIIQGLRVNITDYPYQTAYLHEWDQWCGGVLVSERVVITAQHCVDAFAENLRTGTMGVGHSTYWNMFTAPESNYAIEFTVSYPLYASADKGKDFSIAYLKTPVRFRPGVQPAAMATLADIAAGRLDTGTVAKISGWGNIARPPNVVYPDDLYATVVQVTNEKTIANNPLTPDQITARSFAPLRNADTCQGDSGGPLVVPGPGNTNIVAGITSWGVGCGDPRLPASYAHVAMFNEWTKRMLEVIRRPAARVHTFSLGRVRLPPLFNVTRELVVPMGLKKMVIRLDLPPNPVSSGAITAFLLRGAGESPVPIHDCRLARTECTIIAPVFGLYRIMILAGINVLIAPGVLVEYHSFDQTPLVMRPRVPVDLPPRSYLIFGNIMAIPGTTINVSIAGPDLSGVGLHYRETLGLFDPTKDVVQGARSIGNTIGPFGACGVGLVNAAPTPKMVELSLNWTTLSSHYRGTMSEGFGTEGKAVRASKIFRVSQDLLPGTEVAVMIFVGYNGASSFTPRVRFTLYNNPASAFAENWRCRAQTSMLVLCSGMVPGFAKGMSISVPALNKPTVYDVIVYYTPAVLPAPRPSGGAAGNDEEGGLPFPSSSFVTYPLSNTDDQQ